MKLIHCADLHLDSRMETNLTPDQARERREELLDTFDRMVDYAVREGVRVILIAGDLFDRPHNRKGARRRVLSEIITHPDIDFLYLKGNHDTSDFFIDERPEDIPGNLKGFTEDSWTSYSYGEVVITGRELTPENTRISADSLVLDQAKINIVTLHGQAVDSASSDDRTAVIPLKDLAGKNIDYLALGHIHKMETGKLDDRGAWAYSGCLEGRGFDECGEKGFILLDAGGGVVKRTFIPFAKRTLHEVTVPVDGIGEMGGIISSCEEALSGIPSDDMVEIILTGQTSMDTDPDPERLRRRFASRYYCVKVVDETRVRIDYESFREDRSLKGEFVRLMEEEDLTEEKRSAIIETGLSAIMGEEITE